VKMSFALWLAFALTGTMFSQSKTNPHAAPPVTPNSPSEVPSVAAPVITPIPLQMASPVPAAKPEPIQKVNDKHLTQTESWLVSAFAILLALFAFLYDRRLTQKRLDVGKKRGTPPDLPPTFKYLTKNEIEMTSEKETESLRSSMKAMIERHRHEDNMLNSRLQAFLVTTAFLIGAFAQFRDPEYWPLRLVVALAGGGFGLMMLGVLTRTAERIGDYKVYICEVEKVVIGNQRLSPYSIFPPNSKKTERTSVVLGVVIPRFVTYFWAALLIASVLSNLK
jgi:hypothetical protein